MSKVLVDASAVLRAQLKGQNLRQPLKKPLKWIEPIEIFAQHSLGSIYFRVNVKCLTNEYFMINK